MEGFERPQEFGIQARILKELGVDGYYFNVGREATPEKIKKCAKACSDEGIELAAVYYVVDLSEGTYLEELGNLRRLLPSIPDHCPVELGFCDWKKTLQPSSREGLDWVVRFCADVLPDLTSKKCELRPYPHFNFLIETVSQSLEVIEQIGRTGTAAVASGFHSQLANEDWLSSVKKDVTLFHSISLCGISSPGAIGGFKIESLGNGNLADNRATIQSLVGMGYQEWIGLQGYGIEGDSWEVLSKSATTLLDYLWLAERQESSSIDG